MAKRRKLSKRELKKRRSEAAKRGWITRRENESKRGASGSRRTAARKESVRREIQAIKQSATSQADYEGMLERRVEFLQEMLERSIGAQEVAQKKDLLQDLAERDPELLEASWKQRIFDAWNVNPKSVPETVEDIWADVLEYDLFDYYDESDVWDMYKEGAA